MNANFEPTMVWLNGKIVAVSDATISVMAEGLSVGLGFFETMSLEQGRFFRFEMHYSRLEAGLKTIQFKPPSAEILKKGIIELLEANNYTDTNCRVRVTCYEDRGQVSTVVTTSEMPTYQHSSRLVLSSHKVNQYSVLSGFKSTSYAMNLIALRQAQADGADEALMLNTDDALCEGSTSNIFLVREGQIHTPKLASGCLPGVTRQVVIELCEELKIPCFEKMLSIEDLRNSEEAFLTSSLRRIQPIGWFEGEPMDVIAGGLVKQLQLALISKLDQII